MTAASPQTATALGRVRGAPTVLDALDAFDEVASAARTEGTDARAALAAGIADPDDPLVVLAAVHAAGAVGGAVASALLLDLLEGSDDQAEPRRAHLREHAAWALAAGPRLPAAVDPLRRVVAGGGFAGVLAEATLDGWDAARPPRRRSTTRDGLTVAQLFLHGEIDGSLSHAGQGDTGGIATLLVRLGDALLHEPGVERVLTLSRAAQPSGEHEAGQHEPGEQEPCSAEALRAPGHHYPGIPVPHPAPPASRSWGLRAAALSGVRAALAAGAPVDVLHVRMADVGSWAAAQVAREQGIPLVLTLAPDPHALLASREAAGTLSRASLVDADLREHLVFRVRLLRALRQQADALVVFPRPDLQRDLRALLHLREDEPVHVVPEGIDVHALEHADRQVGLAMTGAAPTAPVAAALGELDELLATLPQQRRDLPLVLSVGRLHPVKGMVTLARAWADHPHLADRCTLVVVGGDLARPTADEAEQLALLDAVVPRQDGPARGFLLAGHRSNPTVAVWLSAARRGRPGLSAPGGVYVCASVKEEFGIALCEALGSGLVVVAPDHGGPPTYVEHGRTGVLVETTDPVALAGAVADALDLAAAPDAPAREAHARQVVADRFSIETMAGALARVYREVAR
ncbi:glycosyltransferase [Ornithinimicrobium pekingense]|uniref:Glycosyltransferase subfamily 4-like N-terminal domain-containing protein n=1 Tax=Ornithinimicrobium pekingense TaxID=384677 RepID=A0ABQ2F8B4_9MICO|nr:glycosyltransferase [Ornithinimicrobium pekingense]GGK71711.1 hypothetical protein GCM10011509_20360 [Ornithinimicrobium pekingense]